MYSLKAAALFAVALALFFAPAPHAAAAPAAPGVLLPAMPSGNDRLVVPVDTFPQCVEQRRCWRTGSGRTRCGQATRCQECRYAKQCDRSGCQWRQVCKWGPYKPVLKTN